MSKGIEELGHAVKKLQHRHHRSLDQALGPVGLSLVQWNALRAIDEHPRASAHELALLSFNSDQAFGTLSQRMERDGLISKRQGKGRRLEHNLSTKGKQLLGEGRKLVLGALESSFAVLNTKEKGQLQGLLDRLLA
jgi:DNA-binding MarR family transcriptional regulator